MKKKIALIVLLLSSSIFAVELTTRTFLDSTTGRQIHAVGADGANTCHQYFTAQSWDSTSTKLALFTNVLNGYGDLVVFDTVTEETTYVDRTRYYFAVVSPTNKLYYTKDAYVYCFDLETNQNTLITVHPFGKAFYGVPSVSNDGTIMTVYWRDAEDRPRNISTINTVTGAFNTIIVSSYIKSVFGDDSIDHPMVNPVYKNLFFYCRNTLTGLPLSDRTWVYDQDLDVHKNIYEQKYVDESLGEYVGHEMWAYNGEKLYFVKYNSSPIKPTGLMWVDKWNSDEYGYVNGDYSYLHASVSPDEKWMSADTAYVLGPVERESDVCLINMKTKKSKILAKVDTWVDQPGHVHPSFSQDSKKVTFTFADENNNLWVGYIDISGTLHLKNRKCNP
ncbi:MAG: hypothetical protein ACIAQZ_12680 [Sedimentisphaeraceae bacterium JB056]